MMKKVVILIFILITSSTFCLAQNANTETIPQPIKNVDTTPQYIVEEQAQYPGGIGELHKFLSNNLMYPSAAMDNGIQGKVIVEFDVCTDGKMCNYKVIQSVNKELDEEALRVIKIMPNWKPAKQNGVVVKSRFKQPITFTLQ